MLPRIFTNRCPVVQWKRRIILQTSVGIHYGFSQLRKLLDPDGKHCIFLQSTLSVRVNMSQSENGQLPLAKPTIRSRISSERWEQIKIVYVSGIGLREIARKMNIPEGTVLADGSATAGPNRFRSQRPPSNQMQSTQCNQCRNR